MNESMKSFEQESCIAAHISDRRCLKRKDYVVSVFFFCQKEKTLIELLSARTKVECAEDS